MHRSIPPSPRRIVLVVDPAAVSQPALEKAARLARAFRARVLVYACDHREGLDGPAGAALRRAAVAAGERELEALAAASLRGVRAEVCYELGHPRAQRILAAVARARGELVVVAAQHHAAARRTLFSAADWPLIRDCPVPLLYAKTPRWPAAPRIAAAVDPLHPADPRALLDRALVARARALARALRGSLSIVHAWLPLEPAIVGPLALGLPAGASAEVERALGAAEARAARAVGALARGGRPAASVVLLRGAAIDTLPGFAELEALDVLALGAVSRSRLYEALIGATAERLLERVPCDLLIVKAPRAAARPKAARGGRRQRVAV